MTIALIALSLMEDFCSVRLARSHPSIAQRLNDDEGRDNLTEVRDSAVFSPVIEAWEASSEAQFDLATPRSVDQLSAREASEWHIAHVLNALPADSPLATLAGIAKRKGELPSDQTMLFQRVVFDSRMWKQLQDPSHPLSFATVFRTIRDAFRDAEVSVAEAIAATRLLACVLPTIAHHPHSVWIDRDGSGDPVPGS